MQCYEHIRIGIIEGKDLRREKPDDVLVKRLYPDGIGTGFRLSMNNAS
jgi:hypothetical protein